MSDPNGAPAGRTILSRLTDAVLDGVFIYGAVMFANGAEQAYHPAGAMVRGIFLISCAWTLARKGRG